MPSLYLTCHQCHQEFVTPIAVTEAGLHDVLITGMVHLCPHCGHPDQYFTQDYHVPAALVDQLKPPDSPLSTDHAAAEHVSTEVAASKLAGYSVVTDPERRKPPA
ncbi:MAG: CpXC domain-containing protein [Thermoplasmata archaeon]|jgi:hypothetical protein|nr:CpXC domain-containing protein [Thermoplasmata archaeon]